ncbi:MAG TPA: ABC transporter ATP-binding protein, partial [Candidatus Izemoplasmatales bacterium]|nr:ABC transporter ATP-binding protein [Candidatus Izemoplasmatales bacterium]
MNHIFEIKDLSFKYKNNMENVLKKINFHINEGEIFGFLGPSGAGKSTTQKIIIKILEDYQGDIFFRGKNLKDYKQNFFEEIGVSFEMPIHFSKMTAMENIDFFQNLYQKKANVEKLMKRVGLWEDKDKMVSEYSKGMKIRLNIVRALLNDPSMLFLDEPTNGLDPTNAKILKDMISDFRDAGGTVFITSHIMSDIDQLCDRVAFIVNGEIKEIDSPRNLKIRYGQRQLRVEYKEGNKTILKEFPMNNLGNNKAFINLLEEKEIE